MKTEAEKLKILSIHKYNVVKYGTMLVDWLIENGDKTSLEDAKKLLIRIYTHDFSKFNYPEWDYLFDPEHGILFDRALEHHRSINDHHPEWWGHINKLLAYRDVSMELAIDWYSRSAEKSRNIFEWIEKEGIPRFNINTKDKNYLRFVKYITVISEKSKQ